MGSEAVIALMMSKPENESVVIGIKGNRLCYLPLIESVEKTQHVAKAMTDLSNENIVEMRGKIFQLYYEMYMNMSKLEPYISINLNKYNLAIMNVGAPAPGSNAAVFSFVRHGIARNCNILGIKDGFEGLIYDLVKPFDWKSVYS